MQHATGHETLAAELRQSLLHGCRSIHARHDFARGFAPVTAEIAQVDGTIGLFAPDLVAAKREVTRFARSAHFVTGELSRRVQTALREAEGRTITADEIAVQALREKSLGMGDGELRADITRRFLWTLNRMLQRGAVTKEGWGAAAQWGAPASD